MDSMDSRKAKLALARKKLKDHQEKKVQKISYQDNSNTPMDAAEDINHASLREAEEFSVIPTDHDAKRTELLITDQTKMEMEINNLRLKISQLESNYDIAMSNCSAEKNRKNYLQTELEAMRQKHIAVLDQLALSGKDVEGCKKVALASEEEKKHILEQLEFTKTVLNSKENENILLHSKVSQLQNDLESIQLRLQQLTNGATPHDNGNNIPNEQIESYVQKISLLEHQVRFAQKERDQINSHYEHYVSELNEQLKLASARNEELAKQVQTLSSRENCLVDQISSMEIQLQNLRSFRDVKTIDSTDTKLIELQQQIKEFQERLQIVQTEYDDIKHKYVRAENKIKELEEVQTPETDICISKLNADIANDKVAAQRATEQNKKLKTDLQELEESFVKMSKDKLELTERLDAEKFLNRELTVKLAEYVEMAKDMQVKLTAKDNEMIRLLANYRDVEGKLVEFARPATVNENDGESEVKAIINDVHTHKSTEGVDLDTVSNNVTPEDHNNRLCLHESEYNFNEFNSKQDSMIKLQERFLKIMDEVADLSDEKHRLEHIILQLQNETDTICEYVALYQQQRSLLKLRDEERSSQIKIFQAECGKMKTQLNELHETIVKISEDKELTTYFAKDSRQNDFLNVLNLLKNMKNNYLVNSGNHVNNMKNFYPCACCSGNLIDL